MNIDLLVSHFSLQRLLVFMLYSKLDIFFVMFLSRSHDPASEAPGMISGREILR